MDISAELIRSLEKSILDNSDCPIGSIYKEILKCVANGKSMDIVFVSVSRFEYIKEFLETRGFKVDIIDSDMVTTYFTVKWRF